MTHLKNLKFIEAAKDEADKAIKRAKLFDLNFDMPLTALPKAWQCIESNCSQQAVIKWIDGESKRGKYCYYHQKKRDGLISDIPMPKKRRKRGRPPKSKKRPGRGGKQW